MGHYPWRDYTWLENDLPFALYRANTCVCTQTIAAKICTLTAQLPLIPVISDKNKQPRIHQAGYYSEVITAFLRVFTDFPLVAY